VARMVTDVAGMKVLIMDQETTGIVSMVYTKTQILQHEVFLIDSINRKFNDKMPHLKAIYFIRPTQENVRLLQAEFREPKYGEYHIFFSNLARDAFIQELAEADEHEVVQQVQEYYCDFLAINQELFSLNVPSIVGLGGAAWDQPTFDRVTSGLIAVLLSLKKRPTIRYQANSEAARHVGETVASTMDDQGELFSFRRAEVPPLLLLLDRKDDPVTPLLNKWFYQAMVHELLGIDNNRVTLPEHEDGQVVLSPDNDAMFAKNMFANWGDLTSDINEAMKVLQQKTNTSKQISSIAEMQSFVESYPQYKAMSANITKHLAIVEKMTKILEGEHLYEVSEAEQDLAVQDAHSAAVETVEALLMKPSLSIENKLRLVLLYALRYEHAPASKIERFKELLATGGASPQQVKLVDIMLEQYGAAKRSGDLFSNKSFTAKLTKNVMGALKSAEENVYTRHRPYLLSTLEALLKGSTGLSDAAYPQLGADAAPTAKRKPPTQIIVFMVGGATYEEARLVAEMNAANPGVRILLGGTCMHNCASFLEEVAKMEGHSSGGGPSAIEGAAAGMAAMGFSPPIATKRIAALTSTATASLTSLGNQAISKLQ